MKTIGLIGGLSWVSSLDYYRLINEIANKRQGGNEAAKIILFSVNYGEIVTRTRAGDWDGLARIMCDAAKRTEGAGADCILIGANTMHHIAEKVQEAVQIPLLHIADAAASAIKEKGKNKVALLGTRYTMLFDFYKNKLAQHGIETMIPGDDEIDFVNNAIYDEMGKGKFLPETKERFLQLIDQLAARGAEAVVLGCTEIPMLIKPDDTPVTIIDTTLQHAIAAVDFALG